MIKSTVTLLSAFLFATTALADSSKPPVTAQEKPKVLKPCKEGQTEADGCHVVKKAEAKKPEAKKPDTKPAEKKPAETKVEPKK